MAIRQISVFIENVHGSLERVVNVLAEAGVDMRALSVADTSEFGILRMIVKGHDTACRVLRDAGYVISCNDVTAAEIPDEPGGLSRVLHILAENGINIEYSYAFLTPSHGKACVVMRVDDNERAAVLLNEQGVVTLLRCEGDESPL
ncbi:MAG: ACT domain-containing protein [Clostridia bacterium]|nr:ACT domain-containing protein [Clostridia bacterium]